VHYTFLLFI